MKLKLHQKILNFLTITLTLLIFVTLIIKLIHPAISLTQDLGRHLKLGEIILTTKSIPKINLFTYTNADFPFVNHHWLSEVIFFKFHQLLGLNSLIILKIILLTTAFIIVFRATTKLSSLTTAALTSALFLPIYLERTHIRPEIFSLLLFSLTLHLLLKTKSQKRFNRSLLLLPLILLLWVNLHIYFAAGLALLTFYSLDKIINQHHPKKYLLLLLTSYSLLLLNPNGLKGALLPFKIFQTYGYSIVENLSPFFLENIAPQPSIHFFKISLPLAVFAITSAILNRNIFNSLTTIFFTTLAFKQIRNFPLYALTLIPFTSFYIQEAVDQLKFKKYHFKYFPLLLLLIGIFWQTRFLYRHFFPQTFLEQIDKSINSTQRIDASFIFFKQNQLQGPIFNNFDIAGLAIYHLYPQHLLFVDNRPEAFPVEFFSSTYKPMQSSPQLFNQLNSRYQFSSIIFAHADITPWAIRFISTITNDPNWSIVFLNDIHMILVPTNTGNNLVERFRINQANVLDKLKPLIDSQDIITLARLNRFFQLSGWQQPRKYTQQKLKTL